MSIMHAPDEDAAQAYREVLQSPSARSRSTRMTCGLICADTWHASAQVLAKKTSHRFWRETSAIRDRSWSSNKMDTILTRSRCNVLSLADGREPLLLFRRALA